MLGLTACGGQKKDGWADADLDFKSDSETVTVKKDHAFITYDGVAYYTDYSDGSQDEYSEAFAFTGAGSTGDGITITKKLGAQVTGKGMMGLMGLDPSHGYYGSTGNLVWLPKVVVNKEGEDFGLTTSFYSETLKLLLDQTDSRGIGIFDSTSDVTDRLEAAAEQGAAKKFNTLEELAEEYDLSFNAVINQVIEYGLANLEE